jgi:hypothetical protein
MRMLKSVRLRLVLLGAAFLLFAVWIGRLAYLALHKPVILARTEFLVADVVILARVESLDGRVTVQGVCWPQDPQALENKGLPWQPGDRPEITVTNLERCHGDWTGPGGTSFPCSGPTRRLKSPTRPAIPRPRWSSGGARGSHPTPSRPAITPVRPESKTSRQRTSTGRTGRRKHR